MINPDAVPVGVICGMGTESRWNGAPLVCGYLPDHSGPHSWHSLPVAPFVYPEWIVKCPHPCLPGEGKALHIEGGAPQLLLCNACWAELQQLAVNDASP